MEFVVNKRELVKGLGRVAGVADRKSAMPMLSNVLMEAEPMSGGVRLSATDLLLSVSSTVRAEVRKAGSVALSARHLFDSVKALPEGEVTVSVAQNFSTRIKGSKRRFDLVGMAGEDFPQLPDPGRTPLSQVPVDDLAELIAMTSFSMSTDDTRPHLSAALFEMQRDILRIVTTDGHRLSKAERAVQGLGASGASKLLIPAKGIHELKRLLDDLRAEKTAGGGAPLTIGVGAASSQGPVFFAREGVLLSSKLVDSAFPSYEQVIPTGTDRVARLSRLTLLDSLRAVSTVASDRSSGVKLAMSNNQVVVSSDNPDVGHAQDEIDAELTGKELTIGFNSKYLIDVLSALTTNDVQLELSGELDPGMVRPVERDDFVGVIMPMRI
jgi:DNA polymerase-3 subunit beta